MWERSLSGYEFLVFEVLSLQEFQECIAEEVGIFPIVETEAHLVQVGLQVFGADLMPGTNNSALEQRKCGLVSRR